MQDHCPRCQAVLNFERNSLIVTCPNCGGSFKRVIDDYDRDDDDAKDPTGRSKRERVPNMSSVII